MSENMKKIDEVIKKYKNREKQGYEYTPIGEVISDLLYIKPKKKKERQNHE